MVDFWQIIGHATTDDVFRNNLYDSFTGEKASPSPPGPSGETNTFACLFATPDYETARGLVLAIFGPVSLMALGEWLVVSILHGAKSRPDLDDTARLVQKDLGNYQPNNEVFYQTLGAFIVDGSFRKAFLAGNEGNFGFKLTVTDRAALATIFADQDFVTAASKFQLDCWDHSCKDMVIQSVNGPYAHALEGPFGK